MAVPRYRGWHCLCLYLWIQEWLWRPILDLQNRAQTGHWKLVVAGTEAAKWRCSLADIAWYDSMSNCLNRSLPEIHYACCLDSKWSGSNNNIVVAGFQVKSAYGNLPPDWKERVPYTLHSFQRSTYIPPRQQPEHLLPVNRYGSNARKHLASSGVSKSL